MKTIFREIDNILDRFGECRLNLLVLGLILLLGVVDYQTGFEFSFSFFYLLPVGLVAWYGRGYGAYVVAVLASAVGQFANDLAGETHSCVWVPLWNDLIQALTLFTVAVLLRRIRSFLRHAKRLAQQDFLTGLPNRRALIERLESELARASRSRNSLVVGFIDLDHFKLVNDRLGHSEGDRLLYSVADALTKALRRSDVVARVGGDEFVVVLPDCDAAAGASVGEKIISTLMDLSARNGWPVTASVGLLYLPKPRAYEKVEDILEAADSLMYEVKDGGRNSFELRTWI